MRIPARLRSGRRCAAAAARGVFGEVEKQVREDTLQGLFLIYLPGIIYFFFLITLKANFPAFATLAVTSQLRA